MIKIFEPDGIASEVVAKPILLEREGLYFQTKTKVEPDTKLEIEISAKPMNPISHRKSEPENI